jgi:uncharacterized protein (DUF488 family)
MGTEQAGNRKIWTIGHSNHSLEYFLSLLEQEPKLTHLVDVRTSPQSGYSPQFNGPLLRDALRKLGINYVHLIGLGGRPEQPSCYASDGRVIYDEMEQTPEYLRDLKTLELHINDKNSVIMCSCGSPENCHRNLSIAFILQEHGFEVIDILPSGERLPSKPPSLESSLPGLEEVRKSKLPVRQNTQPKNSSH